MTELSTSQLLTLILTELKGIKAALQSGGRTSQPPAKQPPQNRGQQSSGGKYAMKPGEEFSTCDRCGATDVIWRKSRSSGKSYLVNEDGAYHSTTCNGGQ